MEKLVGYLGRDRQIRKARHGGEYIVLNLAQNLWDKGTRVTRWYKCIVWRPEDLKFFGARLGRRGDKYEIQGEPTEYEYERDGAKKVYRYFKVSDLRMLKRTHAPAIP